MIRWPREDRLPELVRSNLRRARGCAALKEREADRETWTFELLPWSSEYPLRMTLRNERFEPFEIVIDADGVWRSFRPAEVPRLTRGQLRPAA